MNISANLAELIAKREDPGGYEVLVFEIVKDNSFIMCTKLPNWTTRTPDLYEQGYLQIREFIAGLDSWYDLENKENIPYKYSGIYFWDFIKKDY
jgi:hypothetical protein